MIKPATGALTNVVPSIAAHLGGEGDDVLGLPDARRYVLVLVDGLGAANLYDAESVAPVLGGLDAATVEVGLPSTTATSLTSLTTGVPAGTHGMVGFSFRTRPGVIMHTMAWDDPQSPPLAVQATPTWFERLDVPCAAIAPAGFARSGMTQACLRGADFVGVDNENDWDARAGQAARVASAHALTYVYERGLDHAAHLRGWRSAKWRGLLHRFDGFVAALLAALPPDTAVIVTADHGMVDVPKTHRLTVEDEPALAAGVTLVGGEGRFRHVYTDEPGEVARRWQGHLGARADVRLRQDALEWFGDEAPSPAVADRLGDVVAAMLGDWAVLTIQRPGEASLIGMHGSLTSDERVVPLLTEVT